jgi:hypothetical protein
VATNEVNGRRRMFFRVFGAIGPSLALAPYAGRAQDDNAYGGGTGTKARTQQDIMREREQACRGLKGEARAECLANYVGPASDKPSGTWKKPPNPPKPHGRS